KDDGRDATIPLTSERTGVAVLVSLTRKREGNEGISLSNETLQRLAERGLTIDFDIYDSSDE
ncbi:hypothetical protein, partial [uncultured Roseobacter sp.]|uniref:hypothetical protein n=1 Tax=uncultured Roseobacter sp. TaxID=114847 RepID=UPI00260566CD